MPRPARSKPRVRSLTRSLNMSDKKFNVNLKGFRGAGLGVKLIGAAAILGYGITHSIYTGEEDWTRFQMMLGCHVATSPPYRGSGGRLPRGSFQQDNWRAEGH